MTRPLVRARWAPRAAGALLALLGALPGAARADADKLLKDTAVLGTLASWAAAGVLGTPGAACADTTWRARVLVASDAEMDLLQLGAARGHCDIYQVGGLRLSYSPTVAAGFWQASSQLRGAASEAFDASFVPMLRWRKGLNADLALDLELGIGVAWLSDPTIGLRRKTTQFQFSDHVGLALAGAQDRWRAGLAYRHVSNADIGTPNNGVDFKGVFVEWKL